MCLASVSSEVNSPGIAVISACMEKSDGLPGVSDGRSCPPLQKLHASTLPNDGGGEMMRVYHVPEETLAAIEATCVGCVPEGCVPDGPLLPEGPLVENLPKKSAGGKWK